MEWAFCNGLHLFCCVLPQFGALLLRSAWFWLCFAAFCVIFEPFLADFWAPNGPPSAPKNRSPTCLGAPTAPKGLHFWGFWYPEGTFSIKFEPMITYFCHPKNVTKHAGNRKFKRNVTGGEIFWNPFFEISMFSTHWPYLPATIFLEGRRQWR